MAQASINFLLSLFQRVIKCAHVQNHSHFLYRGSGLRRGKLCISGRARRLPVLHSTRQLPEVINLEAV